MTAQPTALERFQISKPGTLFCLAVFIACFLLSVLIPPFQSPDEFDHIKRAYWLTRGQIVLDAPPGNASGGMLDDGLEAYIAAYLPLRFKPERKLSADEALAAESIPWSGARHFAPGPGTGYYFPLVYLPQAVGLGVGELFGATIGHSVKLARFLALLATVALLLAAFRTVRPNPLVYTLLLLPMALFQMATASLDGVSTALAVFAMAMFLRTTLDREKSPPYLLAGLSVSLVLLITCRVHLLPMLLLLPAAWFYTRNRRYLIATAVATALILLWLGVAIATTVSGQANTGLSTSGIVAHYIGQPLAFPTVLLNTFSDLPTTQFYRESFIGVLGWIDTRLPDAVYTQAGWSLVAMALLSVSVGHLKRDWRARALLLACAVFAVLLVFFALLVTWTPHPAAMVHGVQGRYFLVPALLIAYALGGAEPGGVRAAKIFRVVGPLFFLFSTAVTAQALVERYYLSGPPPKSLKTGMRPSPVLQANAPIKLMMNGQAQSPQPIKQLAIQFGTYMRKNAGVAELRLRAPDGRSVALPFELSDLKDNQYKTFDVEPLPYTEGEIVFKSGGGVSTWEAHTEGGPVVTCMVYEFASGAKRFTDGCPRP